MWRVYNLLKSTVWYVKKKGIVLPGGVDARVLVNGGGAVALAYGGMSEANRCGGTIPFVFRIRRECVTLPRILNFETDNDT